MRTIIKIKKIIVKKSAHQSSFYQNYFHGQMQTNIKRTFYIIFLCSFIQSEIQTKKIADVMKEKLNPLIEEYRRIISKPKQF